MTAPRLAPSLLRSGDEISTQPPTPQPAHRPQAPDPGSGTADTDLDLREITPTRRDLSESLPPDAALLKVVLTRVDGQDCFRLEGYFQHQVWVTDSEELTHQHRVKMILADEMQGAIELEAAVDCYKFLQLWSSSKYGLTRWLTMLRRQVGPGLRLIVWDDTDFGIPWELFWHSMDGAAGWLGAVVQVIRWTTVHDANRHDQFSAEVGECGGSEVLYYEDESLTDSAHSIADPGKPGYTAMPTMEDLLRALAAVSGTYGLVYVRGHGIHSTDLFKATLAGVGLSELEGRALPALRESKSVVFLNACNSARPVVDQSFGDDLNRNFAEIFLRQRATAVVATMAEVPIAQSAIMARRLVRQARSGGVRLPEYLRAHRAKYAEVLPPHAMNLTDAQRAAIRAFLYASAFAYFGHPESVFKLAEQ